MRQRPEMGAAAPRGAAPRATMGLALIMTGTLAMTVWS